MVFPITSFVLILMSNNPELQETEASYLPTSYLPTHSSTESSSLFFLFFFKRFLCLHIEMSQTQAKRGFLLPKVTLLLYLIIKVTEKTHSKRNPEPLTRTCKDKHHQHDIIFHCRRTTTSYIPI